MPKLLIASNNPGKTVEFRELLGDCGWELVSPADAGFALDVDETGHDYASNARIKAEAFSKASGLPSLAEDSGLEVDALNGEPGALHHLNGWDGVDQTDRISILLRALKDVPEARRSARFRSVIVLVLPSGESFEAEGSCEGTITDTRAGEGGFGYDPVFLMRDGRTMAQLSVEEKNAVSHRGVAAAKMRDRLRELASIIP